MTFFVSIITFLSFLNLLQILGGDTLEIHAMCVCVRGGILGCHENTEAPNTAWGQSEKASWKR